MWKQSRGPRLERRRENKRLWRTLASATAASLWLATGPRPASATGTNIYWDPNGAGSPGGSGIWDLNALDWSNLAAGGSDTAWPNFAPSSAQAVFGGTAGTVSLYSGFGSIQLNGITFQNDTTINGPLSGFATLNISGSAPSINVNSFDATINAPLSGSGG
ncbi:MAG TPA: hypothetical protein VLJ39_10630, partial [Tepidisphaeraceae bacterium]|nr:hypothetical protein [Tepidisphaeraceae bacterium]